MRTLIALLGLAVTVLFACFEREARPFPLPPSRTETGGAERAAPRFPERETTLAPSELRLAKNDAARVETLMDVDACVDCHAEAVEQWRASPHALSSFNNPFYRSVVDRFRDEVGMEKSRFCAGCHEPTLLITGAMDREVAPSDPRAHAGITCMVCHGVREVRPDGNGSYTLSTEPVPYPDPSDEESVNAHRARVAPDVLRSASLCAGCHRSFLGPHVETSHHLPGITDVIDWQRSVHAGSRAALLDDDIPERTCQGCHMRPVPIAKPDMAETHGQLAMHRFPGGHQTLAHLQGNDAQESAVIAQLAQAATIDVAAARSGDGEWTLPADRAPVPRGDEVLALDVVVRNVGAGHRFPGGTRDLQDTWIEVRVTDRDGAMVAGAGLRHARGGTDEGSTHQLRAAPLDETGSIEEQHLVHRFRGLAFDHTIPPRDARVVRYLLAGARAEAHPEPWKVEARLLHRRHDRAAQALACEATRSPRGRAFATSTQKLGRPVLDGCAPQPVAVLATAEVWLGDGAPEASSSRPRWRRLYEHALGLRHGLQERLDEARPSLLAALTALDDDAPRSEAMVMAVAAEIAGHEGRTAEALDWLDQAASRVGAHPALARIRADALAQVWRWPEAADAYASATAGAPRDDHLWSTLAQARGSAGDNLGALGAAIRGLALAPRHPDLLRSQALALAGLSDAQAEEARSIYLAHRTPDELPHLRALCSERVPGCRRNRQPIPEIQLR